ncbi:hypothetical protein C0J52_12383 [Blattella germanica]|nr:hypothetical protein C0J52_12383 [Blattella germanica]
MYGTYKSIQLIGYADVFNIVVKTKIAVEEVYISLEEGSKEIGLYIQTILRLIYDPIELEESWNIKYNTQIYTLYGTMPED